MWLNRTVQSWSTHSLLHRPDVWYQVYFLSDIISTEHIFHIDICCCKFWNSCFTCLFLHIRRILELKPLLLCNLPRISCYCAEVYAWVWVSGLCIQKPFYILIFFSSVWKVIVFLFFLRKLLLLKWLSFCDFDHGSCIFFSSCCPLFL